MIKNFKLYEKTFYKPELKRPIPYKCLNLMRVIQEFDEKYNLDRDLFWKWESRMMSDEKVKYLFPDKLTWELGYESQKAHYAKVGMEAVKTPHSEWRGVFEVPKSYDASGDGKNYKKRKQTFMDNMKDLALQRGKTWGKKDIENYDKGVDFGKKNFESVNVYLDKLYGLYGSHYKNGVIPCYLYNDSDEADENDVWGYPVLDYYEKAIYLSELITWIKSFDMDTTGLYEWILKNQFVEGRYHQRVWNYACDDKTYKKEEAPDNIKQINEMLRQLYKDEMAENRDEPSIPIFTDYYEKFNDKDIY